MEFDNKLRPKNKDVIEMTTPLDKYQKNKKAVYVSDRGWAKLGVKKKNK